MSVVRPRQPHTESERQSRAAKWDSLVAKMKNKRGDERRTGSQLMDEAMDYLFSKYS